MGNSCFGHAKIVQPISSIDLQIDLSHQREGGSASNNTSSIPPNEGGSLRGFTYAELRTATGNFRDGIKDGEGNSRVLYKGYLDPQTLSPVRHGHGMRVTVKKLNVKGGQGCAEWVTEVKLLGALNHPNVVRLYGFAADDNNRFLVYENLSRGKLEGHLFRDGHQKQRLSWHIRMKVVVGAARGLAFLHDAAIGIIFRDFKAANILLDDQYNPKLSDFGLAIDGPSGDDTHVSTRVVGNKVYEAPEYLATGRLSPRCDVYSFGIFLLELLSGRRAMDTSRPLGEQRLVEWARPYLCKKNGVMHILDERLKGQGSLKGVHRMATLALQCVNEDAKARPLMKNVVESLEPLLN